jgi:hypothetical protein
MADTGLMNFRLIDLELVDFGFDVKKLYALQAAINQPGNAVEKSQAKDVLVEKKQKG